MRAAQSCMMAWGKSRVSVLCLCTLVVVLPFAVLLTTCAALFVAGVSFRSRLGYFMRLCLVLGATTAHAHVSSTS
eukprot:3084496-Lingulodinium_polyedra.AAC.1